MADSTRDRGSGAIEPRVLCAVCGNLPYTDTCWGSRHRMRVYLWRDSGALPSIVRWETQTDHPVEVILADWHSTD